MTVALHIVPFLAIFRRFFFLLQTTENETLLAGKGSNEMYNLCFTYSGSSWEPICQISSFLLVELSSILVWEVSDDAFQRGYNFCVCG